MAEESDGIDEAMEGQLRLVLSTAGQIGERIARAREDALRQAQAHSEQQARELQSRFEAERRAARVELAGVHRPEWWDNATPEVIGRAYQVARAWAHEDPEAGRAEQRIRDEVRTRYGVEDADPVTVRAALERAQLDPGEVQAERSKAAAERAEAAALMVAADRVDLAQSRHADGVPEGLEASDLTPAVVLDAARSAVVADVARAEAGVLYDSAERREGTARELAARGVEPEQVATLIRADVSQAKPATEAVKTPAGRAPTARRGSRGPGAQIQRTGLDR